MQDFIEQVRAARRRGVNIAEACQELLKLEEGLRMIWVKVGGLSLSILWTFVGPWYLTDLKVKIAREHLDVALPENLIYFTCTCGFISMLAFGFNLVDLLALMGIRRGEPINEIVPDGVSKSGCHDVYRDVVLPNQKDTSQFGASEENKNG